MPHMTSNRLLGQSLRFYWRTNLAIVLGVAIGTAVIGGALIVGDSVRASLRQMTLDRLGEIDDVVTGPRFFREQLAGDLQTVFWKHSPGLKENAVIQPFVAPAILLVAGAEKQAGETVRRSGQVNVYGVDERAWEFVAPPGMTAPVEDGAYLNASLAESLDAKVGDTVTIWIELPSAVPRDTLLGQKDNDAAEVTVIVREILPDAAGAARLGLFPTQQLPLNAFVSLAHLQDALDQTEIAPTRRDPLGQPARVNTLFVRDPLAKMPLVDRTVPATVFSPKSMQEAWTLADLNLRIVHDTTLNVLSVESEQMLLEDRFAQVVLQYAHEQKLPASPMMVYLANWFKNPRDPQAYSMYSTVAGLDVLDLAETFGPFEFVGAMPDTLGKHDVIINAFLAEDLKVQVGDEIRFAYHTVGSHGELPEIERMATVRGIVKMAGAAIDQQLTPTVKGITDAASFDDWEQPFPMKLEAVTARDDDYWNAYRATPKAFFSLKTAQELWPSRYGSYTSVRVGLKPGQSVENATAALSQALLSTLKPAEVGLAFQPVRTLGLQAANGSNDFSVLFISFSFFLILSAVILVGLLFRLAIEQRVKQWGLLAALGYSPRLVRRLMLGEGVLLVVIGGVLGIFAAVGYAQFMLYGLKTWWIGAIGTKFLMLDIQPVSLAIGACSAMITSLLAILWSQRQLRSISLREQLVGVSEVAVANDPQRAGRVRLRAMIAGGTAVLLVLGVLIGVIPQGEAFSGIAWPAVVFFIAGMLMLAAGLWAQSAWLQRDTGDFVRGRGPGAVLRLGVRNAARRRSRSVLTTGLIASASFVIAAVAAGHINPTQDRPDKSSGNGGYTLVAESSSPILYSLNTASGRKTLNLVAKTPAQEAALQVMSVMAFRVKPGEEASCLNLFQTHVPTILGAPQAMIERGGFSFVGGGEHPWDILNKELPGGEVPVLGDMNTLQFSLKKSVGQDIPIPSAENPQHQLQVAGMFNGAVFQGVLVMSEENFLELYPEQRGFRYFLIEVPPEHAAAAAQLLETDLAEYGFDTEPVADRLARFLAVQNTYLSTFQSLGGLGLLLGTFGLATVMLRNVLERQGELALLRAVGFRPRQIGGMVLAETLLLLLWGLATGTLAAWLAMTPQLMTTGADVPWSSVVLLLSAIVVIGLLSATTAVRLATHVPIVSTLRGE
ncbi:FtsX-like permease family protein [bacterium]|nr:FtsX-like permease family protein [bacterium]